MRFSSLAAGLAAAMALAQPAAANLVVNGGFETGDLTGWTLTADEPLFTGVYDGPLTGVVPTGQYHAYFAQSDTVATLEQTIATQVGAAYRVSFTLGNTVTGHNSFRATFGDSPLLFQFDAEASPATPHMFVVTADQASSRLFFDGFNNPGTYLLDEVSVTQLALDEPIGPPRGGPVPEPATWALLIGGFGLAGAMLRRRGQMLMATRR